MKVKESEIAQSCPILCDSVDGSPPGSSVHGILQARVLEWVAISFSRGSSQPGDRTREKEINPEYSLEGLTLKLKLQYFSHLVGRADSLEKDPDAGKD